MGQPKTKFDCHQAGCPGAGKLSVCVNTKCPFEDQKEKADESE